MGRGAAQLWELDWKRPKAMEAFPLSFHDWRQVFLCPEWGWG